MAQRGRQLAWHGQRPRGTKLLKEFLHIAHSAVDLIGGVWQGDD